MVICNRAPDCFLAVCSPYGIIGPAMVAHTRMATLANYDGGMDTDFCKLLSGHSGSQTAATLGFGCRPPFRFDLCDRSPAVGFSRHSAGIGNDQAPVGFLDHLLPDHLDAR